MNELLVVTGRVLLATRRGSSPGYISPVVSYPKPVGYNSVIDFGSINIKPVNSVAASL